MAHTVKGVFEHGAIDATAYKEIHARYSLLTQHDLELLFVEF